MAAERHQAGDDGRLAKADVAHHSHAAAGASVRAVDVGINLLEEPFAAGEDRVHGDAGHLEQQRLQGDVLGPVGGEAHCRSETRSNRFKPETGRTGFVDMVCTG